jgi:hypothetical protein
LRKRIAAAAVEPDANWMQMGRIPIRGHAPPRVTPQHVTRFGASPQPDRRQRMNARSMAGWIGFGGLVMILLGGLAFFQGLIAVIEDDYYVVTRSGFLVFDLTGWGWIMMIWGIILVLVGLALISGQAWARWVSIVLVSLNVSLQLGFLGNSSYPLWTLMVLTLNIIVLYALIVRWDESQPQLESRG